MSRKGRRGAFTLVELLVVIAIIGVLVGLLLPAVQYAREAARRAQCQNSLRQLVLAAQNFEAANQKLPANRQLVFSPTTGSNFPVGWIYDLLPYMESKSIYDRLKKDPAEPINPDPKIPSANGTKISIVICPSDSTILNATDTSYQVNGGCFNNTTTGADTPANGVSDDLISTVRPAVRASMSNCKDGTSQTIFYAENCNALRWNEDYWQGGSPAEYYHCFVWIPCRIVDFPTVMTTPPVPQGLNGINDGQIDINSAAYARPSSQHSTGFQAAFVGGQTRFIRESIDYEVYARLMTSDGARTVNPNNNTLTDNPYDASTPSLRLWQSKLIAPQDYE